MSLRENWNHINMIDYIKNNMTDNRIEVISFDVFDTLLCRPFYYPTDLFLLLNKTFCIYTDSRVHFSDLRLKGEQIARGKAKNRSQRQDISLDCIYKTIHEVFLVTKEVCSLMKKQEILLEKRFCYLRQTGYELFQYALKTGKKIVLISDMYLSEDVIAGILIEKGLEGFSKVYVSSETGKRKSTGDIYRYVLDDLKVCAGQMFHIGDHWELDCEIPAGEGILTAHFPKALEVFEDKEQQYGTNHCSKMAQMICGKWVDYEQISKSVGYRCMLAVCANMYFDNPYRSFLDGSDFNGDPYFIGFYLLGMHITGLLQWIQNIVSRSGYKRIVFLARDGWLIRKAYEIYQGYDAKLPDAVYLYTSRSAVLPEMIKNELDLLELPIDFFGYSPEKLAELLEFCMVLDVRNKLAGWCAQCGVSYTENFCSHEVFWKTARFLWEDCYDSFRHQQTLDVLREYFSQVREEDIFFDMGYSARIQFSINQLSGKNNDVMFVHSDSVKHYELEQKGKFKIYSFYDFIPYMSDVMREIMMSSTDNSCIGYCVENNVVKPVFEETGYGAKTKEIIHRLQQGALDFVQQFLEKFYDYKDEIRFKSQEVSMPWEGYLRFLSEADSEIFRAMDLEDKVYAGAAKMNLLWMIEERLKWLPDYAK